LAKNTRLSKNFLTVLVCPLDWGIGHATRCVPVIKGLLNHGHKVIIAADGRPFEFLKGYFPDLEKVRFPGANVFYPKNNNMALTMALRSPALLAGIYKEHRRLKKIIRDHHVDVVISDNRFGLWSEKTYSVYMTHQVMIKAPGKLKWLEPALKRIHGWFISKYNECWIPDMPGRENLSGELAHTPPLPGNSYFTGILSRFSNDGSIPAKESQGIAVLVMLSGPEPQRTLLEEIIVKQITEHKLKDIVILRGLAGEAENSFSIPGARIFNHMPDKGIRELINRAEVIICRPGYSTLCDLAVLERNAVLVPTPGQTEQEYLASYLSESGSFASIRQEEFSLLAAIQAGKKLPAVFIFENNGSLLEERISGLFVRSGKY
jgi:UDP-N-acetylglucosamine transferase subunit ALG13